MASIYDIIPKLEANYGTPNTAQQFVNNMAPYAGSVNDTGVLGATTGGGNGTGGGGGASAPAAPAYNPDDLAYLNDQEARLNQQMGRADTTLNQGLSQLGNSYNQEVSGANTQRSRALENFGIQEEDSKRGKNTAINTVNTNARTLADSVRRILGLASGSGSSAYQFAAPNAVGRSTSQNRTNVLDSFGKNFRDIDLSRTRAKQDFETLLSNLAEQKQQRELALRGGVNDTKNKLSEALANLAAERAKLIGGGYGQARVAQQPYLDQINQRSAQLDSIFNQFNTPYAVKPVTVNTPKLRDYAVDKVAMGARQPSAQETYTNFLKKQNDEEQA